MPVPDTLASLTKPLFEALPLEQAMPELVPTRTIDPNIVRLVESIVSQSEIQANPSVTAALWLYIDEIDRSHTICQAIPGPVGSLWHAIVHRREGDFWNSKYWFRQAGTNHVLSAHSPEAFVDQVEQTYKNNPPELLERQRQEWLQLFEFSAREG